MQIEFLSEGTILAVLSPEPEIKKDLLEILQMVREKECNAVIDFSHVVILRATSISSLLALRKIIGEQGKELKLCSIGVATRGILAVTGVDELFKAVPDRHTAIVSMTG